MTAGTAVSEGGGGLSHQRIQSVRAALRGDLLVPGAPGYDEARAVYNAMIDRRPGLIARCADVADVMRCVRPAEPSA